MTLLIAATERNYWTRLNGQASSVHMRKARYTLPVSTGVIFWHPCSRSTSTAREHGRHFGHPCSPEVDTTREHG